VLLLRPGTVLGETTDNQITALFSGPVVLGLTDTDVPFVFVLDTDVAEVIRRGVVERITGTFNLAGDGVLTLRDIAAIEGKPFVPVPAWLLAGALHVLSRLRLVPYGPEQVDFLRYRPVLANDALKAAFPGCPPRPPPRPTPASARAPTTGGPDVTGLADERPTALVTGAAGHIGARCSGCCPPPATARRPRPPGRAATGAPPPTAWWTADLADPACEASSRDRVAALPRLDVLVNGAGVTALGSFEATDDEAFRRVMDVNYHGALRVTRAALPALRAGRGHVVTISSVAGYLPTVGRPAYVGAKHAVTGVFRALGAELASEASPSPCVHPAFLATPVTDVGGAHRARRRARPSTPTTSPAPSCAPSPADVGPAAHPRGCWWVARPTSPTCWHRALPDTAVRLAARSLRRRP
jgi:NAD(P)-dependent dehydrogenase (short-subunit alcohol dehydrogenase family)